MIPFPIHISDHLVDQRRIILIPGRIHKIFLLIDQLPDGLLHRKLIRVRSRKQKKNVCAGIQRLIFSPIPDILLCRRDRFPILLFHKRPRQMAHGIMGFQKTFVSHRLLKLFKLLIQIPDLIAVKEMLHQMFPDLFAAGRKPRIPDRLLRGIDRLLQLQISNMASARYRLLPEPPFILRYRLLFSHRPIEHHRLILSAGNVLLRNPKQLPLDHDPEFLLHHDPDPL